MFVSTDMKQLKGNPRMWKGEMPQILYGVTSRHSINFISQIYGQRNYILFALF